jgi:hypothetical protein
MKNSTLVFIILLVNCIGLFIWFQPIVTLLVLLIIACVSLFVYLTISICEINTYRDRYFNEEYNYTIIKRKYNIISIIIDWVDSFPQIIKKK